MNDSGHLTPEQIAREAFQGWMGEGEGAHAAVLSALLDAHLLFQEECLSPEPLLPLFEARWPEASLAEAWERLRRDGLAEPGPGAALAVTEELRRPLVAALEAHLWGCSLDMPGGAMTFRRLMAGFGDYCQTELGLPPDTGGPDVWGGVAFRLANRRQLLLLRPGLLRLRAHPEAHVLVLCPLPEGVALAVAALLVREPALRARLSLYDVESGDRVNLTRGELPVYFERYLRQAHGLRMSPSPAITEGLKDGGLLNLGKG
jgi:hypothetical protein